MIKALLGMITFAIKAHSPEILLGVGVVGVVGSTVLACKATLKAEKILAEAEAKSERIDDCVLVRETSEIDYTIADEKNDRRILVFSTAGKFIRLYGPSATLLVFSLACILGAYRILAKRNVALMAAYKLLEEAFVSYRKRVVAELGSKADGHFLYGEELIEGGETRKHIDEDGVEHDLLPTHNHLTGFARSFEKDIPDQFGSWTGSTQWSKVHDYNIDYLTAKEKHFNAMLLTKGAVVMNDVYSELGFPMTDAGMVAGWRYKSKKGDGYISFKPRGIDGNWAYGQNGDPIVLDFNVDGIVFDEKQARKEMKAIK